MITHGWLHALFLMMICNCLPSFQFIPLLLLLWEAQTLSSSSHAPESLDAWFLSVGSSVLPKNVLSSLRVTESRSPSSAEITLECWKVQWEQMIHYSRWRCFCSGVLFGQEEFLFCKTFFLCFGEGFAILISTASPTLSRVLIAGSAYIESRSNTGSDAFPVMIYPILHWLCKYICGRNTQRHVSWTKVTRCQ